MRKILSLICTAFVSTLPLWAQETSEKAVIGESITTVENLESGTYAAYCTVSSGAGYLYYDQANSNDRPFRFVQESDSKESFSNEEYQYLWTVEKDENGTFKISNYRYEDVFIPADNTKQANMKNPTTKTPAILNAANDENGIYFWQADNAGETTQLPFYICANTPTGYFNLNFWGKTSAPEEGKNGAVRFVFKKVSFETTTTYSYTISHQTTSGISIGSQTVKGTPGENIALTSYDFRRPVSATTGEGTQITIQNNSITLPENNNNITVIYEDNLPFNTTKIQNGEFVNATWYQLGIHNNQNRTYLQYNSEDKTIINLIGSSATNMGDDSQLWCFSGNLNDGFKIYNKAAGTEVSISYSTAYGSGTNKHAIMADANAEAAIWHLASSSATESELSNGFCFETKQATDDYKYLNQRSTYMSYWNNNGNGSTFVINDVNTAILNTFNTTLNKAKQYIIGEGLGEFQDPNGSLTTALDKASTTPETPAEYLTLIDELNAGINALVINQPEPGKFYRIKGASGKYISSEAISTTVQGATIYKLKMTDATDKTTVLFLSEGGRITTEKMQNMSRAGVHLSGLGGKYTFTAHQTAIGKYVITPSESPSGNIGGTTNSPLYDYSATNGAVDQVSNANDAKCAWTLEEVTEPDQQPSLNQTIGSTGYATLAAPVALNVPSGVKAYTVTVSDNHTKANLNEITSGIIPAGCGVVLKAESPITESSSFKFTFNSGANAPEITENALVPLYTETAIGTDITAYILASKNGIGFYLLENNEGSNRTVGANKAYLVLPQGANAVRSILFGGPTTGIEDTVATGSEKEEYYDLQGRRVMNPEKGIYITKSGKKVIFTK